MPGTGGGLPGTGAGASFELFAAAITRRLFMLEACRTWIFSDTLRRIEGAVPVGRRGVVDVPGIGGGGGGARPIGVGTGGFPPTIVDGRGGASMEAVRGRRGADCTLIVEAGRSAGKS